MTEVRALLARARESLEAAELLYREEFFGFAVARAYYAMFYTAQAFLASEGMTFSSHGAVIAAFGKHFIRDGDLPRALHRYLIDAQDDRLASDYDPRFTIPAADVERRIVQAEEFITQGRQRLLEGVE